MTQPVASRLKHALYLTLTTLLGIILSYGIHALVEIAYLRWAVDSGTTIVWTKHFGLGLCALPWAVQYGLFALGAVGGLLVGRVWWRIVYPRTSPAKRDGCGVSRSESRSA